MYAFSLHAVPVHTVSIKFYYGGHSCVIKAMNLNWGHIFIVYIYIKNETVNIIMKWFLLHSKVECNIHIYKERRYTGTKQYSLVTCPKEVPWPPWVNMLCMHALFILWQQSLLQYCTFIVHLTYILFLNVDDSLYIWHNFMLGIYIQFKQIINSSSTAIQ